MLRHVTIISGGQTGADRAALDFAIAHRLAHGGWCPRGRLADDGPIDLRYKLRETPSRRYAQRTEWNVRDSDATAIFSPSIDVQGGTALTLTLCRRLGKPAIQLSSATVTIAEGAARLTDFLRAHRVERLNVAGPRASHSPEIGAFVEGVLLAVLDV